MRQDVLCTRLPPGHIAAAPSCNRDLLHDTLAKFEPQTLCKKDPPASRWPDSSLSRPTIVCIGLCLES